MIKIAKLILFSSFIKSQVHSENLVQYISTRDGVEYNTNKAELNGIASEKQVDLINDISKQFPELKEIDEYKNYIKEKSKKNASEFITEALGLIEDQAVSKEIYLKYISERPRVEKLETHGLFNSQGEANLKQEIENIKNHKGVVWTHIISLKREDAERLGYDNLNQWQLLLKTKINSIAESMHIDVKNLVWNAAFHNEGHHPHVHLVMYSKDTKEGFVNEKAIERIKSVLMNEIYKDELLSLKQNKSLKREEIKSEFQKEVDKYYENIVSKNFKVNDKLINNFLELSKVLPNKGKLVYGYQDKEVKKQVDKIVNDLLENENIKKLYNEYSNYKKDLAEYYSGKDLQPKNITEDKEFRKLQNIILKAAENLIKSQAINNDSTDIKNGVNRNINNIASKIDKLNNEMDSIEHKFKKKMEDASKIKINDPGEVKKYNIMEEISEALEKNGLENEKDIENNTAAGVNSITNKIDKLGNKIDNIELEYKKKMEATNNSKILYLREVRKNNIMEESKEALDLKDKSLKNIEDKFLIIMDEYMHKNDTFKNYLNEISKIESDPSYKFKKESRSVQDYSMKAARAILNDPRIKVDYENYLKACKDYGIAVGKDNDLFSELEKFQDEILANANINKSAQDEINNKVIEGAKKLKDSYNLNKKLNVQYNDYSKQNKDDIKYMIKNIIFDIVDAMYFSAKEEEFQKNRIDMRNRKFLKHRHTNSNSLHY